MVLHIFVRISIFIFVYLAKIWWWWIWNQPHTAQRIWCADRTASRFIWKWLPFHLSRFMIKSRWCWMGITLRIRVFFFLLFVVAFFRILINGWWWPFYAAAAARLAIYSEDSTLITTNLKGLLNNPMERATGALSFHLAENTFKKWCSLSSHRASCPIVYTD